MSTFMKPDRDDAITEPAPVDEPELYGGGLGIRSIPHGVVPNWRASDNSRISGVIHLRATPFGVLQPLILLCEAYYRRNADLSDETLAREPHRVRMTRIRPVLREESG